MVHIKSNTSNIIRLLAFIATVLIVLVLGICIFVIFGQTEDDYYLYDKTEPICFSLHETTARLELYQGNQDTYVVPASVTYRDQTYPITEISAVAFKNNQKLKNIKLGDNVIEIAGDATTKTGAFSGCNNLTQVTLGNNVVRIGAYAFKNCLQLKEVYIPASVQQVAAGAFKYCLALKNLHLANNGQYDPSCFEGCNSLTTLALADEVVLGENIVQAVAKLDHLQNFVINNTNTTYALEQGCVVTRDATNGCAVVLGGKGATLPADVNQIQDWAFGARYHQEIIDLRGYPIGNIGVNAFTSGIIYTDALTKPVDWQTILPVYCQTKLVTFTRYDGQTARAYVYQKPNGQICYPDYTTLFDVTTDPYVFKQWGEIQTDTNLEYICAAEYEDGSLAAEDATVMADFESVRLLANAYFNDAEIRKLFTFDFWENFKAVYAVADTLNLTTAKVYEVKNATKNLQEYTEQITAVKNNNLNVNDEILEDTNWRIRLKNLVDTIVNLDLALDNMDTDVAVVLANTEHHDLVDNQTNFDLLKKIKSGVYTANKILADEDYNEEAGDWVYSQIRNDYESLMVDLSKLQILIKQCESLDAAKYTTKSWQELTTCLIRAKQMGTYNLCTYQVRLALQNARDHLVLAEVVAAETYETMAVWLALCNDLYVDDYEASSCDQLLLSYRTVVNDLENLKTTHDLEVATSLLQTRYRNLQPKAIYFEEPGRESRLLSRNTLPFFIVAIVLFTGAVIAQAFAAALNKQQRKIRE